MEKRKVEDTENIEIRRKIRRLEQKLQENRGHGWRPLSRSSSEGSLVYMEEEYLDSDEFNDEPRSPLSTTELTSEEETYVEKVKAETSNKPTLPKEILNILGKAKKSDMKLGEKIPDELSERWGKILVDGLAKEHKEDPISKMLIPENFLLARAPKLNPEIAAVLPDAAKNRDKRLERTQNQLGASIASLVNLTKQLIDNDNDIKRMDILKNISETSQILDLHYEESLNRRRLLLPLLDGKFFSIIQGVKRDMYLFGDNLAENIKISKSIEKSGLDIRKAQPQPTRGHNRAPAGNSRAPLRQPTANATRAPPTGGARRRNAPPARRGQRHASQPHKNSQPNRNYERHPRR